MKGQLTPWKPDASDDVLRSVNEAVWLEILKMMQLAKVLRWTVWVGVKFGRWWTPEGTPIPLQRPPNSVWGCTKT